MTIHADDFGPIRRDQGEPFAEPDPPTPSFGFTDAMRRAGAANIARQTGETVEDPQEVAELRMAEQLRERFAQPVLDTLVILELGLLSTEPELSSVEVPTITVQQIMEAQKARARRAGA